MENIPVFFDMPVQAIGLVLCGVYVSRYMMKRSFLQGFFSSCMITGLACYFIAEYWLHSQEPRIAFFIGVLGMIYIQVKHLQGQAKLQGQANKKEFVR